MKDVNKVILIGRLGSDPMEHDTKTGNPMVSFSLATHHRAKVLAEEGAEPSWTNETQWHRVIVWGKQAEHCAIYLKKGQSVYVEGTMKSRKYKNSEDEEKTAFEVHADEVNFLSFGAFSKKMNSQDHQGEVLLS